MNNENNDITPFINLYDTMKNDAIENGINMFNENNDNINNQNMFSYFYHFIKKYIIINKKPDNIIDVQMYRCIDVQMYRCIDLDLYMYNFI